MESAQPKKSFLKEQMLVRWNYKTLNKDVRIAISLILNNK
jgi:hypothetical protein